MGEPTRRALLRGAPALLGALAGCEAFTGRDEPPATPTTTTSEEPESTPTAPERTLELRNSTDETRFVSVAVSDGDGVVSASTVEVPAGTARSLSLAAPTGILTVELETESGQAASQPWAVGDEMGELVVTLTDDGFDVEQKAWCTPTCDPLSRGGTAAEFPYYGDPAFMTSYYGANVVVENTTTRTLEVTVRIEHERDAILDYAYVLPPGVRLEFPGVHSAGDYTVTVRADVGERVYAWRPPKERRLEFRLTETGVQATCGKTTASFVLRNDDTDVHSLRVSAYRPNSDIPAFTERYIVQPGANYRERGVYTGSGQYVLEVETGEGASETYDWWLCPPRGPTAITIQPNGTVHVVQFQPGE